MKEKNLFVRIPENLKFKLDLYALKNDLTLKDATVKILEEKLATQE